MAINFKNWSGPGEFLYFSSSYHVLYILTYFFCWKVDLTAYVEQHEFCFDAVLDEDVSNDEVLLFSCSTHIL
jgi:hypothetical protein